MHRLRAYVRRHPLWLGFVAAVLPLVALLVLQYLWLAKLQKTSAVAQMAYLNHFLEAVATRLAPICVTQSGRDPAKAGKLVALKGESSWQRGEYVGKQGWATMPGATGPDGEVADTCARQIAQ